MADHLDIRGRHFQDQDRELYNNIMGENGIKENGHQLLGHLRKPMGKRDDVIHATSTMGIAGATKVYRQID